jgi:probable F420-dependent oxidoreductase
VNVGLTVPFSGLSLRELGPLCRRAEELGYESLWSAEATELDAFTPLAVAAQHTERARLVSGIVSVFTRGRVQLAQTAAALQDLSGGRFTLGLGASSNVIVQNWNGIPFQRPLTRVRETVDWLRPVLAGERGDGGFKLAALPDPPVPIVLAALRDRMLRLAAERADGAFTNFLPISGVPKVVEAFGSEKELAIRLFSVPGDEEQALPVATRIFAAYVTVPVYTEYLRWLGRGDEIDPMVQAWHEGDRARALELAPAELVREIFLLGPVEAQRERIDEFGAAGIHTAVLALGVPGPEVAGAIEAFAP